MNELLNPALIDTLEAVAFTVMVLGLFWLGLYLIYLGLWLRYWVNLPGYRECYMLIRYGKQLDEARDRRQWYRLHNGQPYREWVRQRDGTLVRLGPRLVTVRFLETDAPATLRDLMNGHGFVTNEAGQWVRRPPPVGSAPE